MQRAIAALVLAAFLPIATTGCFGGFQLTRKVYKFNREVSPDKWVRELAFLVLIFFPAYEFASFIDAVLFNSIEFWTGKNPVLAENGATRTMATEDGMATLTRVDHTTVAVRIERNDGRVDQFQLRREEEGFAALTPDGKVLGRVRDDFDTSKTAL